MDYNIELILFERDVAAIIEVYLGGKEEVGEEGLMA